MRRALDPRPSTQNVSVSTSLPAPTGGWNTRDGLAEMPITDAIALDNWYPEATDVRPRLGSTTYASGIGSQVETLFSYTNGANLKLFIAAGNIFQNISTVGTSGTVTAGSVTAGTVGFQNSRFQYRQCGTPGGNFLVAVNGADERQIYNGSTWFAGSASYSGTVAPFSNVEVYQTRLFYLETGTLRFGYHTNTNAIGGTISMFDLASEMTMGGSLKSIGTWTRDGGSGMDDMLAMMSDRGQIAVYTGTDPGSASNWSRLGIFKTAPPLSARCMQKFGGELLIGTESGVIALSNILAGLEQQTLYTDKIRTSVNDAVAMYRGRFGWELTNVAYLNWLIVNVPVAVGNYQQQFVMNTQTGAWCRFKDWNANTFCFHNSALYFGTNGKVIQAATGEADNGLDINVDARQAATNFEMPGRSKHFKMFRPLMNSDGALKLAADINVDFSDVIPTNIPDVTPVAEATWDVATWDDFYWADGPVPSLYWESCGRWGTYGSIRIKGEVNGRQINWYGTDVVFEPGGIGP